MAKNKGNDIKINTNGVIIDISAWLTGLLPFDVAATGGTELPEGLKRKAIFSLQIITLLLSCCYNVTITTVRLLNLPK